MWLEDVSNYLTAMGAVSVGWVLKIGDMPDDQDQTIVLFETPGLPADTMQRENERLALQSRVRGPRGSYETTREKWQEIFDRLQDAQQINTSPVLLPGFYFIQAAHYGPLYFVDSEGRPNFCSNWRVMKARS